MMAKMLKGAQSIFQNNILEQLIFYFPFASPNIKTPPYLTCACGGVL